MGMNIAKMMLTGLMGGGDAASFTPTDLSGLTLWLDANDSDTLFQDSGKTTPAVSDGDPVGCWTDKSESGYDCTQTTAANRPTLKTGANGINNLPVVLPDGTNDQLMLSPSESAGSWSIYAVVNWTGSSATRYLLDTASGRLILRFNNNSWGWYYGSTAQVVGTMTTGNRVLSWVLQASGGEIFENGASDGTGTYSNTGIASLTSLFGYFSGGNNFNAALGEFLVYNTVHSASERGQVESYLADKWGITF